VRHIHDERLARGEIPTRNWQTSRRTQAAEPNFTVIGPAVAGVVLLSIGMYLMVAKK